MSNYYRISDPSDVRDLSEQMAAWVAAGNPKANDWTAQPAAPSPDAQWQDGAWIVPPAPTYSPEAWTSQHFTAMQVSALQRFEMALLQAGKPLGSNMTALKAWMEGMLVASVDATPRTCPAPPCSYEQASAEAVEGLQSGQNPET
jgi:hypothetical protein